jgi:hypothetical protein
MAFLTNTAFTPFLMHRGHRQDFKKREQKIQKLKVKKKMGRTEIKQKTEENSYPRGY